MVVYGLIGLGTFEGDLLHLLDEAAVNVGVIDELSDGESDGIADFSGEGKIVLMCASLAA